MVEKGLTKKDLEQIFKGFEKRQDEKTKAIGKKVVDQFQIISEGLIDQIKPLAEGHSGIINRLDMIDERLDRMEKENERQHLETRALVKISFTELDRWLTNLESQMKEMQEWKKQVEGRLQI
jgi:hypothetical protein